MFYDRTRKGGLSMQLTAWACLTVPVYFSHSLFKTFLFDIKSYSEFFYKVQISTYYEKIILKCVVLSIALASQCTILHVVREITLVYKRT